jgi:hypothetical protein
MCYQAYESEAEQHLHRFFAEARSEIASLQEENTRYKQANRVLQQANETHEVDASRLHKKIKNEFAILQEENIRLTSQCKKLQGLQQAPSQPEPRNAWSEIASLKEENARCKEANEVLQQEIARRESAAQVHQEHLASQCKNLQTFIRELPAGFQAGLYKAEIASLKEENAKSKEANEALQQEIARQEAEATKVQQEHKHMVDFCQEEISSLASLCKELKAQIREQQIALQRFQSEAALLAAQKNEAETQETLESIKLSALIKLSSLQRKDAADLSSPRRKDSVGSLGSFDMFCLDTTEHQVNKSTCAEKAKSWWYHESTSSPIRVLSEQSPSKKTDKRIRAKLLVGISEEVLDGNGDSFLKLADGSGWLHASPVAHFKKWEVDETNKVSSCSKPPETIAEELFNKGFSVQHLLVMAQVRQWGCCK